LHCATVVYNFIRPDVILLIGAAITSGRAVEVDLRKVRPNRFNPRLDFNEEELRNLADSIREKGLLQPIIVRPVGDGFEVVVGERRYRAAQKAGIERIPVVIREYSDEDVIELGLIENIQRTDLSAVEKGISCKQLMEKYPQKFPNKGAIAKALKVSETTVSAWLELVEAPIELQRMIAPAGKIGVPREQGKIDWDTAVTITRQIDEPERQVSIAREIARRPVYRRQAREVISKAARQPERPIEQIFKEVVEAPYEMPFRLAHMKPILDGTKIQTSRKGIPDPRVKVGSLVHAAVWEPHFATLRVVSMVRKRLGEFTEADAKREGGYTLAEFKKTWKDLHGDWDENEFVYVFGFQLVEQ
jgi:ParB family chromosome partitioning protein